MPTDGASCRAARRAPAAAAPAWIALGVALLVVACGASPPAEPGQEHEVPSATPERSSGCRSGTLAAAAGERRERAGRTVLLDAPAGPADRPVPLAPALHGFRSDPDDMREGTGLSELARREGVVVAYPEGHAGVELLGTTGVGWDMRPDQTTDRDFLRALIDELERERCIDR